MDWARAEPQNAFFIFVTHNEGVKKGCVFIYSSYSLQEGGYCGSVPLSNRVRSLPPPGTRLSSGFYLLLYFRYVVFGMITGVSHWKHVHSYSLIDEVTDHVREGMSNTKDTIWAEIRADYQPKQAKNGVSQMFILQIKRSLFWGQLASSSESKRSLIWFGTWNGRWAIPNTHRSRLISLASYFSYYTDKHWHTLLENRERGKNDFTIYTSLLRTLLMDLLVDMIWKR
jgi:hypothetical protein